MMRSPRAACVALAVFAVSIAGGTAPPASPPVAPALPPEVVPPPEPGAFDEPLRLVGEASRAWAQVNDYTCILVRRERVGDRLQPEEVMLMKVRREPSSVYLRWVAPQALAKQEACYVAGRNEGKMRVRGAGLLGAIGFVSLEINDPRGRERSTHTITEAGVGPLIERLRHEWEAGRSRAARVRVADAAFDVRPGRRVEVSGAEGANRVVVQFDRETHLPVRAEWYEMDELREADAFTKMRLNVGLGDRDFEY